MSLKNNSFIDLVDYLFDKYSFIVTQIRDYAQIRQISLVFEHKHKNLGLCPTINYRYFEISLDKIKNNKISIASGENIQKFSDQFRWAEEDGEWTNMDSNCLSPTILMDFNKGSSSLYGSIDQRKGVILLVAKFFLGVEFDYTTTPFDFALCCFDLYHLVDKPIHSQYIQRFMSDVLNNENEANNLTQSEIKDLEIAHNFIQKHEYNNEKNKTLIDYLVNNGNQYDDCFNVDYVTKFCQNNIDDVKDKVRGLFGKHVSFGGVKSKNRTLQKYNEYCQLYILKGYHAYQKFKDLFRGTISCENYINQMKTIDKKNLKKKISEIKYRTEGVYRACYVILNIDSLNFELKIVKNVEKYTGAHEWYELSRDPSIENLKYFISQQIDKKSDYNETVSRNSFFEWVKGLPIPSRNSKIILESLKDHLIIDFNTASLLTDKDWEKCIKPIGLRILFLSHLKQHNDNDNNNNNNTDYVDTKRKRVKNTDIGDDGSDSDSNSNKDYEANDISDGLFQRQAFLNPEIDDSKKK